MHSFGLYAVAGFAAVATALPTKGQKAQDADVTMPVPRQANGTTYSGDMTHYSPGLGSCGITSTEADPVVALAYDMMKNPANPNDNPKCGGIITISYNGAEHQATIVDSCSACAFPDIDLSPTLFAQVAPDGDGRVHNVQWWFDDPSMSE